MRGTVEEKRRFGALLLLWGIRVSSHLSESLCAQREAGKYNSFKGYHLGGNMLNDS